MDRVVHFILHVPKCAGTTVEGHFRTELGEGYLLAPRWENPIRNVVGNRYPSLRAEDLGRVKVVTGHSLSTGMRALLPGAKIRESVLLRDPTGYLLSFYNYRWTRYDEGWGGKPPDFERWYSGQRRNPISRFLLNRYFEQGVPSLYRLSSAERLTYLESRLQKFHFVGSYRRASEMIGGISEEIGIAAEVISQNVTPNRRMTAADLGNEMRRRIETDNALDQALFDRWADRGWSGAPSDPPMALSSTDQIRYLVGDAASGIIKKLIR